MPEALSGGERFRKRPHSATKHFGRQSVEIKRIDFRDATMPNHKNHVQQLENDDVSLFQASVTDIA